MRTDENFPYIPGRCETKLDVNAPELSGQKRTPTRKEEIFVGKAAPEYANDVIYHYLRIYFESLDCIINAIEDRFDQENFRTYMKLQNLLLKATKDDAFIQECKDVVAIYDSDFDGNRFQVQLETLQEYCTNLDCNACIRSVTDNLQNLKVQSHLSEVFKLTKLILALPVTSSTSKRTFSLLKLIKSCLLSTMKQIRLNHLIILNAYKIQLDQLNLTIIYGGPLGSFIS